MNRAGRLRLVALLFATLLVPVTLSAQVTLYPSRAAWEADFPGAALETFEEADLSASDPEFFAPPLDSTTDNTPFDPGDIEPGLALTTRSGGGVGSNLGAHLGSFPSKVVGSSFSDCDSLEILFSPAVDGFAADLFVETVGGNPSSVRVQLFDGTDSIISQGTLTGGATSQTPVFLGLHSTTPIALVNINNPPGSCGGFEWIDDIAFGSGGPPPVPTMSAAALVTLALVLTMLVLVVRVRRVAA